MTFKLGKQHQDSGPAKFVQMINLDLPWPTLQQGQLCSLILFYWQIYAKILDFIETIELYELKAGTNSWLSEYMNTYECYEMD